MDLESGTPIVEIPIDRVFIGSCTNARLEDLKDAAEIVRGKTVNPDVNAMIVPGSQMVKHEAEKLGLDKIFKDANFEWRESGCSMCLEMNPDILKLRNELEEHRLTFLENLSIEDGRKLEGIANKISQLNNVINGEIFRFRSNRNAYITLDYSTIV